MIRALSPKQREVLTWWRTGSEEALICDGAVRSGKTLCMGLAFFLWAMTRFQNERFALCGKTVQGVREKSAERGTATADRAGAAVEGTEIGASADRFRRWKAESVLPVWR